MGAYLKIDGIDGECQRADFSGFIDMLDWGWGCSQLTSSHVGKGSSSSTVDFQELHVSHLVEKSSPTIMGFCASSKTIPKVELVLTHEDEGGEARFYEICLENAKIKTVSLGGSGAQGGGSNESLTFTSEKVKAKYTEQQQGGGSGAGTEFEWDVKKNTGG